MRIFALAAGGVAAIAAIMFLVYAIMWFSEPDDFMVVNGMWGLAWMFLALAGGLFAASQGMASE